MNHSYCSLRILFKCNIKINLPVGLFIVVGGHKTFVIIKKVFTVRGPKEQWLSPAAEVSFIIVSIHIAKIQGPNYPGLASNSRCSRVSVRADGCITANDLLQPVVGA